MEKYIWFNGGIEFPLFEERNKIKRMCDTSLLWACNECWSAPCECGKKDYGTIK